MAPRDEEVRRLQIAVDDARVVRFGDRLARLEKKVERLVQGQAPALVEELGEVHSLEVFHHHVGRAVLERADVRDLRDVLTLQLHRRARLAEKSRDGLGVPERVREEKLQRDALLELDVHRRDDDAHPALAEHALDAVFACEHIAFVYR